MTNVYLPEGSRLGTAENNAYLCTPSSLEGAMNSGAIVEGTVTLCDERLCLHVDLGCMTGIIEPEEAVYRREGEERKDIAIITRVGKPVCFCILSIERRGSRPIAKLSRRLAQKRCIEAYLQKMHPGDLIAARVTHLEPFGAFLDIGCGVSSLLSVDCISVSRISHPRDRLTCGATLTVAVKSIDRETGRIYVTLRELLGTWEENAAQFEVGQTVTGIIRSVESYGIFVELAPNLAGLAELREGLVDDVRQHIGHSAAVYIKSISPQRMKIKLILIDLCGSEPPSTSKKLPYFVDCKSCTHLSNWVYSPASSQRRIETVFDECI